ncbi:PAS domain-containing protein [Rhodobacter calidifons]|uniref:PAS domain-containing protein n=1 Tax=Rhodobacter calidifons TaxID=2715277 RepID=A0ABX0G7V8_9RHOB|nr:PAS domain-containing protein [Rhodobacter calidifons]NHB77239.1 PAS domain-containing protein [Rhodobacter calidifons]
MTPGFLDRFRSRHAPPPEPPFDGLAQLRAYWESLRRAGALPARSAIDPRGLGGILDRVFLAERIGRGLAQIRIAGSGLVDFAGTDLRGLPLGCLFAAGSRPQLGLLLERAFAAPAVVELDLGLDRAADGGLVARLLLLPLADTGPNRPLLGAISFTGAAPAQGKLQLRSWRDEPLHLPSHSPAEAPVQPIRRLGHLALVHVSD